MYTIEVNSEWRNSDYGWDGYPSFYYIVRNENGEIMIETDWEEGFTNEQFASRFMEANFPGIQFSVEGDI